MKKNIILVLLFFLTIVPTQAQIDSIKLVDITTDSLVFVVHFSTSNLIYEYNIEYEEDADTIRVNILYSMSWKAVDCYCPRQTTIKIRKDIYLKAIVSIMFRNPIGGTEENPEYPDDYWLNDSKAIDLSNITSIDNPTTTLNKIPIFPNPVQNVLYVDLGENKTANLEIYDLKGDLLLNKNVTNKIEIDVSFLSSGLYFIVVDKNYIYKIIKE